MTPVLAWLMVLLGYVASVEADPTPAPTPAPTSPAVAESSSPASLESFLDQIVPERLEATGAPGVLVAVVKDGQVLLVKGWGFADVERQIPMDGERTIFRVASISKTLTATAVARLEARGLVDLDVPVDTYLEGRVVPPRYSTPVTLRHLLTHTGGFINHNIGRVSRTPPTEPLDEFMARTMPPQLYPPGRVILYSNHGNALAGLVVQQVSGQPFAQFMQQQILGPLGMADSRFGLDPVVADRLATGTMLEDGVARTYEYLYVQTTPASALHTTAADMARYMIFHLGDGRVGDRVVLDAPAMQRMRSPAAVIHSALPEFHYAFVHGHVAGYPARRHGGSVPGFQSRLVLLDAHGLGVFVGHNAYGTTLRDDLAGAIVTQLLGGAPPPPPVVPMGDGRPVQPDALVGSYQRVSLRDTPGFCRFHTVLSQTPVEVGLDAEGFLIFDGARFLRTGELTFHRERTVGPATALVFVRDPNGEIRWLHRDRQSAQRRPWHAAPAVQWPLHGAVLLVLLVASVGGPVLGRLAPEVRQRLALSVIAARLVFVGIVVPLLYAAWIDQGQPPLMRPLRFGVPWWIHGLRALVVVGAGLVLFAVVRLWRAHDGEVVPPVVRWSALVIALAIASWLLLELYWSTPAPGLILHP
ncbi:MAG: serine hydrolase domain-containing protein [Myxococcota bacterium]